MRVWHFIAYAYIFSLNMQGHEASMARSLFFVFLMRLYLHPFFLCVGVVKALVRLSACVAVSRCWRLIGCTMYT